MNRTLINNEVNLIKFPTTRFQGSKRKIRYWIYEAVKDLNFETCLDGFGGSAVVSYLFKRMNKKVTYNDILKFNYFIGLSIIENNETVVNNIDISNLLRVHDNIIYEKFVENKFKNIYYLDNENKFLDLVLNNLNVTKFKNVNIQHYKRSIVLNAIFQAALQKRPFNLFHRKNLNIRLKNIPRTFGNKQTWEKDFKDSFIDFVTEINSLIFDNGNVCRSLNQSIFDIDPFGYDLVYFDPPYYRKDSSNETSDYLRCYHFLEGLSNYNNWNNLIDYNSTNLRFKNSYIENKFNFYNISESIEILFDKFNKSIIVFSYKSDGYPSVQTIISKLKKIKKNVYSKTIKYNYALNHQNGNAKNNREVLIIGY